MASLKLHITFPENRIKDPIIYQIGHEFKIVTNIRRSDVTGKVSWMDIELTGEVAEIERAVAALKSKGVKVDPIERNVIE
jgi:ABC-type methionine transport system ATPase subunit